MMKLNQELFRKKFMTKSFNTSLEDWNRFLNDNSDLNIPAKCRAGGPSTLCIYHDVTTDHVFVSENDGPLKKANPLVRAMATGKKYRGPEEIDPLPSKRVCLNFTKKLAHSTMVGDMLDFIFEFTEPLKAYYHHEDYQIARDRYLELLFAKSAREFLSNDKTNSERWICIIRHITNLIDELSLLSDEAE
ncbi:hypothetical protein MKK68_01325 [Methylobacterium sp. E-016]|uniref:hypothetical protein n=1 Tax=Methylobacterium sp. E-016 TaxID=2836556 RepID=UPI001FBAF471|nr:hypothetical protein [Methylobacterium sp. E-016]MCJ2074303.1 hypothetical protein [Methylobacterium sp. E-016]